MQIYASHSPTYLYVNGLSVPREIVLREGVSLLPACATFSPESIRTLDMDMSFGVAVIFLSRITSQIKIVGELGEQFAIRVWNAGWDVMLVGAFFQREAVCNFECPDPAEKLGETSALKITNMHFRGLASGPPAPLSESDVVWVEKHFEGGSKLMSDSRYSSAIHALSSYRWHSVPRAQIAVLWAGIEGLFEIDGELVFRISLYISRFLEPNDEIKRRELFHSVKRLYSSRSKAVHGATLKGSARDVVTESAQLLCRLIRCCAEAQSLPDVTKLAP